MTDPRKLLLEQIAALRRTIDPALLNRVRLASEGKEPYDRDAARAAVRGFLTAKTAKDGGAFQRRLLEALKKEAGAPLPVPEPPPRSPPPKRRAGWA
ncbi:MAG: hypothetical protein WCF85_12825 [Rhodospirillaceae bacterium]